MFDGFFGQYAVLGMFIFMEYFIALTLLGFFLKKIFKKKFIILSVVFIGSVIFYFFSITFSFAFIGSCIMISIFFHSYFSKK